MIEKTGGKNTEHRRGWVKRVEDLIPEQHKDKFRSATLKALRTCGINIGVDNRSLEMSPEDHELVNLMLPYVIDHGCLKNLEPINPSPTKFKRIRPDIEYDNKTLDPVPVLSAAMLPYLVRNDRLQFVSVDGEGIYGHNEVSSLEADRAIRKMLKQIEFLSHFQTSEFAIVRFKGDHFVITDSMKVDIKRILNEIQLDKLGTKEIITLSSFRIDPQGEMLLDIIRMHEEHSEINEKTVKPFEKSLNVGKKLTRLKKFHPELKHLLQIIEQKPDNEKVVLLGILEESLFDPRLQKVAEKYSTKEYSVNVFNDLVDMQGHIVSRNSGLMKLDIATSLKSINGELLFGEEAGDQFLTSLFEEMVKTLQKEAPALRHLSATRRWGDFYFVDEKVNCKNIADVLLKMFDRYRYVIIKKSGKGDKNFQIKFVKDPPDNPDKDTFILPLMPIVGVDEQISLQSIDEGTEILTAEAIKIANQTTFSTRLKIIDEEIRALRPRVIAERLESANAVDVEFFLFKMLNPEDKKRGLVRLKKLLHADPSQIIRMVDLEKKINSEIIGEPTSSKRVKIIKKMMDAEVKKRNTKSANKTDSKENTEINDYLAILFDLTLQVIKEEKLDWHHNGVHVITVESALGEAEKVNDLLNRSDLTRLAEVRSILKKAILK